jgi:ABC-type nitrate/sulfonate/bicarbonate transport system substrate-binding protein
MTDDELRTLVAGLATATARNTEAIDRNAAAVSSLTERFEDMRENMSYNTQAVADGLELAAASNRTAANALELSAAAMELSANTSRNLDRLEQDIADLQQMMGIVIRDNQADRSRITRLEE